MSSIIHWLTNVSATLAKVGVRDTGRSLSMEDGGLILGTGPTVAHFHCVGPVPHYTTHYRVAMTWPLSKEVLGSIPGCTVKRIFCSGSNSIRFLLLILFSFL